MHRVRLPFRDDRKRFGLTFSSLFVATLLLLITTASFASVPPLPQLSWASESDVVAVVTITARTPVFTKVKGQDEICAYNYHYEPKVHFAGEADNRSFKAYKETTLQIGGNALVFLNRNPKGRFAIHTNMSGDSRKLCGARKSDYFVRPEFAFTLNEDPGSSLKGKWIVANTFRQMAVLSLVRNPKSESEARFIDSWVVKDDRGQFTKYPEFEHEDCGRFEECQQVKYYVPWLKLEAYISDYTAWRRGQDQYKPLSQINGVKATQDLWAGQTRPKQIPNSWQGRAMTGVVGWCWFDPKYPLHMVRIFKGTPEHRRTTWRRPHISICRNGLELNKQGYGILGSVCYCGEMPM